MDHRRRKFYHKTKYIINEYLHVDNNPRKAYCIETARMVELVDTLVSGTSAVTGMEVQVFFRAK